MNYCCENCQLEQTDPELYKMRTSWLGHAQSEEFHQKHAKGNRYMFGYHKAERLKLEEKMRKHKNTA